MRILNENLVAQYDAALAETDQLLENYYPGDRGVRQPVHTLYVPADRYTPDLPKRFGQQALELVNEHGGMVELA